MCRLSVSTIFYCRSIEEKSLGRETGFKDKTQGTLFLMWQTLSVVTVPKHSFGECENLMSHDKGNTFKVIKGTLEELRYSLHYLVMDGQTYVPQHRERIMIVGLTKMSFMERAIRLSRAETINPKHQRNTRP